MLEMLPWTTWAAAVIQEVAIVFLILSIWYKKSCKGLSGLTQILLALTFTARYSELWSSWITLGPVHAAAKIFILITSYLVVHLIYSTYKESHDETTDNFPLSYLVLPVTILAFMVHYNGSFYEILWAWSIYMEVVALIPQLYLSFSEGSPPPGNVIIYVFLVLLSKAMHLPRYVTEYQAGQPMDMILVGGATAQVFVDILALIGLLVLKLEKSSCRRHHKPSIYTLPHVVQQIGKDYKLLGPALADDEEDLFVRGSKSGKESQSEREPLFYPTSTSSNTNNGSTSVTSFEKLHALLGNRHSEDRLQGDLKEPNNENF